MRTQNSPDARTPEEVVTHHVAVFTQHDLEGVLSDDACDAIFIAPKQRVQGKPALRHLSESFFSKGDGKAPAPAPVFEAKVTPGGDVGYEHWVTNRGTPGSMASTDAFVVRHGKSCFTRRWRFILRPPHSSEGILVPEEGVEPTRPIDAV
jgi:ketosteroid isomerase-like protein